MRAASGTYVGNGVDGRTITVGFGPDVVIVKDESAVASGDAVARTSTMVGDISKPLGAVPNPAADLIQSLTGGGFTVGQDPKVNANGVTYHWTALKAAAGELAVGTYTGNAPTDDRPIPVAFQPDWVLVMGMGAGQRATQRNSAMTGDLSCLLAGAGCVANQIQALTPTGFDVGTAAEVNANGTAYHYVAVKKTPGRFNSGIYAGDLNDNRNITGIGFQPIYVVVRMTTSVQAAVARPEALEGDQSLFFGVTAKGTNLIQALLPDGFQVGLGANVNAGPTHNHMWVAFGGTVNYRSIGTAAAYTMGTVQGTPGSATVAGTGTQWVTANRGRGDRILIDGTDYTIHSVDSETQLRLTTAYVGTPGPGKAYTISRQYTTLQAWEDCISFQTPTSCSWFQVPSANLIADMRSEVGIAYDDAVGADFAGGLVIDGSGTDSGHTITLTADGGNRHFGLLGQGVLVTNGASALPAVSVFDDNVTVEWLEVTGGSASADGIRVNLLSAGTGSQVVVRKNLVHNVAGDGVAIYDDDGRVDVINNIVHNNVSGVWLNPGPLAAGSRFRILNNTFFNTGGLAKGAGASATTLLLQNNISFGNAFPDYAASLTASLDPASSHNLSEDGTAATASPAGGAQSGVTLAQVAFFSTTVGGENLHIRVASVAREQGTNLGSILGDDVDGTPRPVGAAWDKGADEAPLQQTNYRSIGTAGPYATGTVTVAPGTDVVTGNGTSWVTNNRGQGDRILIQGTNYTILTVTAEDRLRLTEPYAGPAGTWGYTIARQFGTLQEWEDCISFATPCTFFPVASASFAGDNRSEVGVAYKDSAFTHSTGGPGGTPLGAGVPLLTIDGSATDATHTITLTAIGVNRHYGLPGTGVVLDKQADGGNGILFLFDDHLTIEWLEIKGGTGATCHGVRLGAPGPGNKLNVRYNLIHDVGGDGFYAFQTVNLNLLLSNNIIHTTGRYGVYLDPTPGTFSGQIHVLNNTVANTNGGNSACFKGVGLVGSNMSSVTLSNNIAYFLAGSANDYDFPDVDPADGWADVNVASQRNLSSDASAFSHNRTVGGPASPATINYTNFPLGNLHLNFPSDAIDGGADLSSLMAPFDIDGHVRPAGAAWDIGADEYNGTTEVRLSSFTATPGDGSVLVEWRTASELRNLGFHLHRGLSADGPWTRLTPSLIPGLGSSAVGQSYSYRDAGLQNGTRYHYRLEDVDASSKTTSHGPVSAVPQAGAGASDTSGGGAGADKKKASSSSSCPGWVLSSYASSVGSDVTTGSLRCTRHGDPEAVVLEVVSRDSRQATLELRTGGFYALHTASGPRGAPASGVRLYVPGFEFPAGQQSLALPIRRALLDAVVGRRVQLGGVRALELESFAGLVPGALGKAEMQVGRDGTVRAVRRGLRELPDVRGRRERPVREGRDVRGEGREARDAHEAGARGASSSAEWVKLLPSLFQGEQKSAVVELSPLRYDAQRGRLVLAKRLRVKVLFTGREAGESGRGSLGRSPRVKEPAVSGEVLARLYTTSLGLHAVSFEQLFPGRARSIAVSELRLERQGEAVGFHAEPDSSRFGPGSRLFFHADRTAASTDFTGELAYELLRSRDGVRMPVLRAAPGSNTVASASSVSRWFETDRFYQPGLLEAPDLWLWDGLPSGATRVKGFTLSGVSGPGVSGSGGPWSTGSESAALEVDLQGASESGQAVDHHVSVSVNGVLLGEAQFAGKRAYRMSLSVPVSVLREGSNELQLTNVADTGVSSYVFLDRFSISHPQASALVGGRFEGSWGEAGAASVAGSTGATFVLDLPASVGTSAGIAELGAPGEARASGESDAASGAGSSGGASSVGARWLTGFERSGGSVRFQMEAGRRYIAVSQEALLSPRVAAPSVSSLRAATNQADYLLIAPRAFLAAAEPLVERRRDQGLAARAVAFEEIADEFGRGQPSAEAIRSFLAHAYHSWARPSPRYVVLLGDSSYDPRNFIGTSQPSPLPALWAKTSYLWTASDPRLAAVNGEDESPDLAIGRLPATTLAQAETLIAKLLAWEDSGQGFSGAAALVADNPDLAGDFEADVRDVAESYLADRNPQLLFLSELGAQLRPSVRDALNGGLSFLSYVGHGGAAVWASENVWNSWDAASLQSQSQQPLLVTMNCLNGYFVAPAYESLSESLVKAEGRGAIAAFSPSGLSLDGPAHQYHRALMRELTSGRHERLGDAVLAAQAAYAETGLMPELLSVYHMFGDPATRIR